MIPVSGDTYMTMQSVPCNTPLEERRRTIPDRVLISAEEKEYLDRLKSEVLRSSVVPHLRYDIDSGYRWCYYWRVIGRVCSIIAQILTSVGGVLSFIASSNKDHTYSMMAGIASAMAVVFINFSTFCKKNVSKKIHAINDALKQLGIHYTRYDETIEE